MASGGVGDLGRRWLGNASVRGSTGPCLPGFVCDCGVRCGACIAVTTTRAGVTRRTAVSSAVLLGVGAGLDHVLGGSARVTAAKSGASASTEAFYGFHQAGVATPTQDYLNFAAFDVTSGAADDLRSILEEWTAAAARLTAGKPFGPAIEAFSEPPVDTGEATGLGPARLTVTIGVGPELVQLGGPRPLRLGAQCPSELRTLPAFQARASIWRARAGTSAFRRARMTRRSPSTRCTSSRAIASSAATLRWSQQGLAAPPPPVARRRRHGT